MDILESVWDSKNKSIDLEDSVKSSCLFVLKRYIGSYTISSDITIEEVCSVMEAIEYAYMLGYCDGFYSNMEE